MSQPERNYYEILRVSTDASADDIEKAYKGQLEIYHPDRLVNEKGGKPNLYSYAEEESKLINIAHDVLSDPEKRAAYDKEMGLSPPCPIVTPDQVEFKDVKPGSLKRCIISVSNVGGHVHKLVVNPESSSQRPEPWIEISEYDDSQDPMRFVVEVMGSRENTDYSGYITVRMDDVEKRISFKMNTVKKPAWAEVTSASTTNISGHAHAYPKAKQSYFRKLYTISAGTGGYREIFVGKHTGIILIYCALALLLLFFSAHALESFHSDTDIPSSSLTAPEASQNSSGITTPIYTTLENADNKEYRGLVKWFWGYYYPTQASGEVLYFGYDGKSCSGENSSNLSTWYGTYELEGNKGIVTKVAVTKNDGTTLVYSAEIFQETDEDQVSLSYRLRSPDGRVAYEGNGHILKKTTF